MIATVTVPFLIFVIPRMYASLHPDPVINPDIKINLDDKMKVTLLISMISFTMLFLYLFSMVNRISKIKKRIEEKYE